MELKERHEVDAQEGKRVNRLRELGAERFFKEEVANPEKFFRSEEIHLAGSGICLPDQEIDRIITERKPIRIESHQGCGAGKLQVELEAPGQDPEDFTKSKTRKIAERNGIEYAGHRPLNEMNRPENYHDAQVCYYDGTGYFGTIAGSEAPRGFVVTRAISASLCADAELSGAIAFGSKGLGEYFNPERPFMIVVLGHPTDPELSLEKLSKEVQEEVADKSHQRVKIDGYTVPLEWLPKPGEVTDLILVCVDEGCCKRAETAELQTA